MQPDRVLHFEPPEAHALEWLPLAVRFKLDACGRKVRLAEWQALPQAQRRALLSCPAGARFERLLLALVPHARPLPPEQGAGRSYAQYLLARLRRVHPAESAAALA